MFIEVKYNRWIWERNSLIQRSNRLKARYNSLTELPKSLIARWNSLIPHRNRLTPAFLSSS